MSKVLDRILIGNILTFSNATPVVEAVGIKDGVIVALGSADEIKKMSGQKADYLDLPGKTVLPGFIDTHVHPVFTGASAMSVNLAKAATIKDVLERLEAKLEQYPGQLMRASVELAKDWRTDRYLRRLEAMMLVADEESTLALTGTGDVLEPEHGTMAIGSGGNYAYAAARALMDTEMKAEEIARRAMEIASDICVYTNGNIIVETMESKNS